MITAIKVEAAQLRLESPRVPPSVCAVQPRARSDPIESNRRFVGEGKARAQKLVYVGGVTSIQSVSDNGDGIGRPMPGQD